MYDKNGKSLGYGYIMYATKEGQQTAIKEAYGIMFRDKYIEVADFKRKSERPESSVESKCNLYFK